MRTILLHENHPGGAFWPAPSQSGQFAKARSKFVTGLVIAMASPQHPGADSSRISGLAILILVLASTAAAVGAGFEPDDTPAVAGIDLDDALPEAFSDAPILITDKKGDPLTGSPAAHHALQPVAAPETRQAPEEQAATEPDVEDLVTGAVPVLRMQFEVSTREIEVLGVPVEIWTYNGHAPGTIVRVEEGTRVEITLVNGHSQTHSLHTHFRGNLIGSDGSSDTAPFPFVPHQHNPYPVEVNPTGGPYAPRHDRDVADPGQSYTYTFFADTPGQFIYHCHVWMATDHIERGLFGMFIVYPKGWTWEEMPMDDLNGNTKARVWDDRGREYYEDVVFITEVSPAALPVTAPLTAPAGHPITSEYPTAVTTSGYTPAATGKIHMANYRAWNDPYIVGPVQPNERIIMRVVNLGDEMHDWHVHAHWFDVIDKTSREKKPLQTDDTWLLGPGDSIETHMTAGNPGHWFMHDHIVPEAYTGMVPWLYIAGDPVANTPPDIFVDSLVDGAVVAGNVVVMGRADNFEGREMVQAVQVRVDDGEWTTLGGLLDWRYVWDTRDVPDGPHTLRFRSYDGRDYSPVEALKVEVRNDAGGESTSPLAQIGASDSKGLPSLAVGVALAAIGAAGWVAYRRRE